jgi:hypothetical protein
MYVFSVEVDRVGWAEATSAAMVGKVAAAATLKPWVNISRRVLSMARGVEGLVNVTLPSFEIFGVSAIQPRIPTP